MNANLRPRTMRLGASGTPSCRCVFDLLRVSGSTASLARKLGARHREVENFVGFTEGLRAHAFELYCQVAPAVALRIAARSIRTVLLQHAAALWFRGCGSLVEFFKQAFRLRHDLLVHAPPASRNSASTGRVAMRC